jgi:transcriptional regulator with XRE-family HTH domain
VNIEACFGRHLRKIREEKRLSQEELAFRSNLDRTYISLLERGKRLLLIRFLL